MHCDAMSPSQTFNPLSDRPGRWKADGGCDTKPPTSADNWPLACLVEAMHAACAACSGCSDEVGLAGLNSWGFAGLAGWVADWLACLHACMQSTVHNTGVCRGVCKMDCAAQHSMYGKVPSCDDA